ncbi:MAG: hypothetical protein ACOYN0_08305, partial [Phycisphaerales bacterium]
QLREMHPALASRTVLRWLVTMYFVMLGWLIFRITDFDKLRYCIEKFVLFDRRLELSALGVGRGDPIIAILLTGAFCVFHAWSYFGGRIHDRLDHTRTSRLPLIYAALAVVFFFLWPAANAAFIYFQF